MIVKKQYDSHVHWLMTGQAQLSLSLSALRTPEDLSGLSLNPYSYRGDWIYGFGWDENKFTSLKPHRKYLDQVFGEQPVFFVRADGHSSWVSTKVLSLMGLQHKSSEEFLRLKDFIECDEEGNPTGWLKEKAHMMVYSFLPAEDRQQTKHFLQAGLKPFHQQGFTHIREMTSSPTQWQISLELENEKNLFMHVEHNFVCESVKNIDSNIQSVLEMKQSESRLNKARGIKIFYDGSLGSETAFLSQSYPSGKKGNTFFQSEELRTIIRHTWKANLDISFHVIGDQAAHDVVQAARQVSAEGVLGKINLEHVQVLRPDTIQMMKPLHLRCFMQPCHWLSDQVWLKQKLGPLYKNAFPWEALRKAQIPLHFGSDSPIEPTSLNNNLLALEQSAKEGIPHLQHSNYIDFHQYPFQDSVPTETVYEDGKAKSIIFDGEKFTFQ